MNPHNWNLAKFPNHKNYGKLCWISWFILMGIFNRTLYNKLIVQNMVENTLKGQMKRAQALRYIGYHDAGIHALAQL